MRRVFVCVLILLASSSLVAAPAPLARTVRQTDLDRIRGEWEVVSITWCAFKQRVNQPDVPYTWTYAWVSSPPMSVTGGRLRCPALELDEELLRAAKGLIDLRDSKSGNTILGIYKLTGDTLTIHTARGGEPSRPTFSEEKRFKGDRLMVLRRKK